jgi:hypothetical protein
MFEVGRQYRITTDDGVEQSYYSATVLDVDLPLIKLDRSGNYEIVNTATRSFVSAKPDDAAARAAEEQHHKEFMDSIDVKYHPMKTPTDW